MVPTSDECTQASPIFQRAASRNASRSTRGLSRSGHLTLVRSRARGGGREEGGGGTAREAGRPRAIHTESDGAGPLPKCPILSKCHPLVLNDPILSYPAHRYFLTCYTREADDEQVDGLRPRARRRSGESPSAERAGRITRLPSDPTMMLASLLSAGMLEAGRAVRYSTRARGTASAHLARPRRP